MRIRHQLIQILCLTEKQMLAYRRDAASVWHNELNP